MHGTSYYGGPGTFAITLSPGRHWFFASINGDVFGTPSSRIRQVTVVGTVNRAPVPTAAVARFAYARGASVTLPRTLPTHGFVLGIGARGLLSTLVFSKLLPGITDAELNDGTTCISDGLPVTKQCFAPVRHSFDGGAVSGGASALWYYSLPPGDYPVGLSGHTCSFDWCSRTALQQRITVR